MDHTDLEDALTSYFSFYSKYDDANTIITFCNGTFVATKQPLISPNKEQWLLQGTGNFGDTGFVFNVKKNPGQPVQNVAKGAAQALIKTQEADKLEELLAKVP